MTAIDAQETARKEERLIDAILDIQPLTSAEERVQDAYAGMERLNADLRALLAIRQQKAGYR